MDADSARKANLLVGNEEGAPVLELLFTGARFRVLSAAELAITGAEVESESPAVEEFLAPRPVKKFLLASFEPGFGLILRCREDLPDPVGLAAQVLTRGPVLASTIQRGCTIASRKRKDRTGFLARFVPELVRERFDRCPVLRLWRGPEWECFLPSMLAHVF